MLLVKSKRIKRQAVEVAKEGGEAEIENPYFNQRVTLRDSCAYSAGPIEVVIERGKILKLKPETTWYLRGGG